MNVTLKRCRNCGKKAKTIAELKLFCNSKSGFMGKENFCKECRADYMKKYNIKNSETQFGMGFAYCISKNVAEAWANQEVIA